MLRNVEHRLKWSTDHLAELTREKNLRLPTIRSTKFLVPPTHTCIITCAILHKGLLMGRRLFAETTAETSAVTIPLGILTHQMVGDAAQGH